MTAVILVRPQMGENIGAAARAMLNFGFTDLRLVAPRDGWPNEQAIKMSSGSIEQIKLQVFESFANAITDLDFLYATTARTRDMNKNVVYPPQISLSTKTGIVFGPERTGLENAEISLCDTLVQIPVNPSFSSLNLAQSVAIICYQIQALPITEPENEIATKEELLHFFSHLERELDTKNFFSTADKKPRMMMNIQNLFARANLSPQEVRTLRGIIRCLSEQKKL